MNYAMVDGSMVVNLIVAEPEVAAEFGALPVYEGCVIGGTYEPPREEPVEQPLTNEEITEILRSMTGKE